MEVEPGCSDLEDYPVRNLLELHVSLEPEGALHVWCSQVDHACE